MENGKVIRLSLSDGRQIPVDSCIVCCDIPYAFTHLLDNSYLDPTIREYLEYPVTYPVYGMFQAAWGGG
ncbi:MAG: hypothetical protein LKE40_04815 [Spirochaetia bacterium]|jgi:hypothetical protein|nr:hypothetical protein [Spirochaetia bacterium]